MNISLEKRINIWMGIITYMTRCLTLLAIGEMQIKIMMKYHYLFIKMAKIFQKSLVIPSTHGNSGQVELSYIAGRNAVW